MQSSKYPCRINNNKTKQEKRRRLKIDTAGPEQRVRSLVIQAHTPARSPPSLTSYPSQVHLRAKLYSPVVFKSSSGAKLRHEFRVNVVSSLENVAVLGVYQTPHCKFFEYLPCEATQ
jgi:hypothetical protein